MKFEHDICSEIFGMKYRDKAEDLNGCLARSCRAAAVNERDKDGWYQIFYDTMNTGRFFGAGRIMANAGTEDNHLVNCFVISVSDSLESIYDAVKKAAQIAKAGGGVGFNISNLRPKSAPLSKGGVSSGPVSFLEVFNASSGVIQVGGGRRSAQIAVMNIDHPDIVEFIKCKQGDHKKRLQGFNLSVGIIDGFVEAVKDDDTWDLKFGGIVYETMKARELYDILIQHSYINNEPGLIFLDRINYYNNLKEEIECVNPCGELPLAINQACTLSVVNWAEFVSGEFSETPIFHESDFGDTVRIAVRFLDNIIDITNYPLPEIEAKVKETRRIGVGLTGLGDMLAYMKLPYDSEEARRLVGSLMKVQRDEAYRASVSLAEEKGPYPAFDRDYVLEQNFIKELPDDIQQGIADHGLRNSGLVTIQPAGTVSLVFGNNCSSGCEPVFSREYTRTIRQIDGSSTKATITNNAWKKYKEVTGSNIVPDYFKVTNDIDPTSHLLMQETLQGYNDGAISKTVNLPGDYSLSQYKALFYRALDSNIKGMTTFNPSGSMAGILSDSSNGDRPAIIERSEAPPRPKDLPCEIHQTKSKGEDFVVLVGLMNGAVYEIWSGKLFERDRLLRYRSGIVRKTTKREYLSNKL